MDYEVFLSSQRWAILEIIAKKPSSPVEISQQIGTSVSYVSQQLKLLEAAGLVLKTRTGSADKGKPRLVYSIARELLYFTGLVKLTPIKKYVSLDEYKKAVLRIWSLQDEKLHYVLEKLFWKLNENLLEVKGVYFDEGTKEVFVVSESKKIRAGFERFREIKVFFGSKGELKKSRQLYVIYDPHLLVLDNLKGGKK